MARADSRAAGVGIPGRAGADSPDQAGAAGPLVKDMSRDPVHVVITAEPPRVEYDRDILLTIAIIR